MQTKEYIDLFVAIQKISRELNTEVYIVGGFVRDLYYANYDCLQDIDFLVSKNPKLIAEKLQVDLGGDIKPYPDFLTCKLVNINLTDIKELDFAEFRTEIYRQSGALPTVGRGKFSEDSLRRDFTINTLILNINSVIEIFFNNAFSVVQIEKHIIDNLQRINDLKNRVVRILHNQSFSDDPTRIFRAIRYKLLIKGSYENATEMHLQEAINQNYFKNIDGYRISGELEKLFNMPGFDLLDIFRELNRFHILERLEFISEENIDKVQNYLSNMPKYDNSSSRFYTFMKHLLKYQSTEKQKFLIKRYNLKKSQLKEV